MATRILLSTLEIFTNILDGSIVPSLASWIRQRDHPFSSSSSSSCWMVRKAEVTISLHVEYLPKEVYNGITAARTCNKPIVQGTEV